MTIKIPPGFFEEFNKRTRGKKSPQVANST